MIATIQLFPALLPFQLLLDKVTAALPVKTTGSVSLSYSSIKLKLTGSDENSSTLYFQCVFQIQQQQIKLVNVYAEQKNKQEEFMIFVNEHLSGLSFNTDKSEATYSPTVINYLAIADAIAKQSYLCSSGDDYHPGYYSEIIIEETQLVLKQINRHNSRSIDHKNDYHLRELEFYIPLQPTEVKLAFQEESIGEMKLRFFDHSSQNNKSCGDRIKEQIEIEKLRFSKG